MAKRAPLAMKLPEGASVADFDVSGGLGALASGVTSKLARTAGPKAHAMLQELLGEPLVMPKTGQLLRVSSVEPAQGIVRLHTNTGERILTSVTDFVKAITNGIIERVGWVEPGDLGKFDSIEEGAGYAGERIPQVTSFGPKGGQTVTRRPIPPKATR